eukprot:GEMP01007887.1.p1 GENE.GEMP01007887.1~~GEMP01007887.1.p1  ORF type:complete len:859 (+),score=156.80 GEMP01007887.1:123-2699(+)
MIPDDTKVVSTTETHVVDGGKHTVTKDVVTTTREYVVEKVVVKRKKKPDPEIEDRTTTYQSTLAGDSTIVSPLSKCGSRTSTSSWKQKRSSQLSNYSPPKRTSRRTSDHSPHSQASEPRQNQMPPEGTTITSRSVIHNQIAGTADPSCNRWTSVNGSQTFGGQVGRSGSMRSPRWRKKVILPTPVGDDPTEEHNPLKEYEKTFIQSDFLPRGSQLLSPEEASKAEKQYQNIDEYITELRDNPQNFNLPDSFEEEVTTVETKEEMDSALLQHNYGILMQDGSKCGEQLAKLNTPMRQLVIKPSDFESPAEEKLVQDGQSYYIIRYDAKWFRVRPGLLGGIWIGHDLEDELVTLEFYDSLSAACVADPTWMYFAKGGARKFGGIIRMKCRMHTKEIETRNLFLTQNFFSGYVQLRKIDFLIGRVTSISGWRGTSGMKVWTDKKLSAKSNSIVDDCRAISISFPSESLVTHLAATSGQGTSMTLKIVGVKQFYLQNMQLYKLIPYIFDLKAGGIEVYKRSEEYLQSSLVRMVNSMYNFTKALGQIKTPQKWLSTLLSIGFDAASDEMRWRKTVVRAHNWKMSTVTTKREFEKLSDLEQDQLEMLWNQYKRAINNIEWELMRYTYHRSLSPAWGACVFELENSKTGQLLAYGLMNNVEPATHTLGWHFVNEKLEKSRGGGKGKGKGRGGKKTTSTVKIFKISGNYRLLLIDLVNLPTEISKVKFVAIHCVCFQLPNEAIKYYNILKGTDEYSRDFVGRVFSQPSRVFTFETKDNRLDENYFFSESIITGDMISYDKRRFMEGPFPPHLRDLGVLKLEDKKTACWAHNTKIGKFSVYQKRVSTDDDELDSGVDSGDAKVSEDP